MGNMSNFVKRVRDIMRNDAGINGDAQRIEQIAWMLFLKVYDAKEQDWEWDEEDYQSIIPEKCRWRNWGHDEDGKGMTGDILLDFINNTLFPTLKNLPVNADTPIKKAIVQTTFADANNYMKDGVLLRQVIGVIDELDLTDYEESHAFGEIYETILKELQSAGSSGEFYTPRAVTDFMAQMIKPQIGEKMADFACGTGGFITSWLKELKKKVKTTEDEEMYANSIYGIEKKQFPYMLCITNMLLHDLDVPQVFHDNTLLRDVLDYTEDDQVDVILMNPPYGGSEKTEVKNHFPSDLASSETADVISEADYTYFKNCLKRDGEMFWYFVIRFLAATGARVSELIQIKVEHVRLGHIDLYSKGGKLRRIYIPKALQDEALSWLAEKKQESGFIFLNKYGDRITTRGISGQLKKLAVRYNIDPAVVYPHSFRHRFAKSFLERCNDIAFLADLMGHESIETTRIYLRKTATEQRTIVDNVIDW